MDRRLQLHEVLKTILGSSNVYFQPPSTVQMTYPCIVYKLATIVPTFADDCVYSQRQKYTVTVIDRNPDGLIPGKVSKLPFCKADNFFTFDNLNHYPFTLYY